MFHITSPDVSVLFLKFPCLVWVDYRYDKTSPNHYVFVKKFSNEKYIILLLYVDDMSIVDHDKDDI